MSRFHMTNVIRSMILSCQYKTSSANKLVGRKVHFFLLLRNKKYAKKGTHEFVQLGETTKIGCSENEYFYSNYMYYLYEIQAWLFIHWLCTTCMKYRPDCLYTVFVLLFGHGTDHETDISLASDLGNIISTGPNHDCLYILILPSISVTII